ncbi:MAG: enoyl-CoA hydratase [Chloroflexi bacterium]|nr:enoyl-CoA hydratase [Chloroflexota bacterium]
MGYETILLEVEEETATVTLNRPRALNAINFKMVDELASAFTEIAANRQVRAVLLTGAGRAFCSGADVKEMADIQDAHGGRALMRDFQRVTRAIAGLDKPVITAVNGVAAGGGCSVALTADMIIAAEGVQFIQIFARVGLVPDMGSMYFIPRMIGLAKAKELMLTAEALDAREAERLGMVNHVVPANELLPTARALARRLAQGPTVAFGMAKAVLNRTFSLDFATFLELEAYAQGMCFPTEDYKEGTRAFLDKREPRFKGV